MKKVFSLWLLDIAKYVITVLVLTTILTDIYITMSRWVLYTVCFVIIVAIIAVGVYLYKSAENDEKEKDKLNNLKF